MSWNGQVPIVTVKSVRIGSHANPTMHRPEVSSCLFHRVSSDLHPLVCVAIVNPHLCATLIIAISNFHIFPLQQYLKPGEGPIVLVLAPTRELAVQIKEECDKFGASSEIKNTVVYGGVPIRKQIQELRNGVEIVIATPGRLIDHLEQGNTNLRRVTYLVLDEGEYST